VRHDVAVSISRLRFFQAIGTETGQSLPGDGNRLRRATVGGGIENRLLMQPVTGSTACGSVRFEKLVGARDTIGRGESQIIIT